jgi:hypothetical protein
MYVYVYTSAVHSDLNSHPCQVAAQVPEPPLALLVKGMRRIPKVAQVHRRAGRGGWALEVSMTTREAKTGVKEECRAGSRSAVRGEGGEVVDAELLLEPVGRLALGRGHDACIGDEHVQSGIAGTLGLSGEEMGLRVGWVRPGFGR